MDGRTDRVEGQNIYLDREVDICSVAAAVRRTNLHHLESQLINIECYILMDVRHDTLFYFVARRILDTLLMSAYLFIFSFLFVVTEMTI